MPRKRHNKWKRQRGPPQEEILVTISLEEDLRLQRLRQNENKKQHDAMDDVHELDDSDQAVDDDIGAVELQSPSTISSELPHHIITNGCATRWPDFAVGCWAKALCPASREYPDGRLAENRCSRFARQRTVLREPEP